jgi:alkanesulfonate monooxygenase SsuD/methylene tetrahydromethanopterin reductase-like flavin-dependent oxidoreductase (luciferase family)
VWIPSQGSSETVAWASDPKRKYPFLVTFSSADLVARYHNTYREKAREYGYEAAPEQLGWACPIYVAETDERARAEAGHAVETLFNDFLRQSFEMLMPPGYTSMSSMKNFIAMRRALGGSGGRMTAEGLIDSGTALIGSPKTVLAGIERMRERTGFGILVALLQFGVLSDALTRRNMDMFAAEVMPHLRG